MAVYLYFRKPVEAPARNETAAHQAGLSEPETSLPVDQKFTQMVDDHIRSFPPALPAADPNNAKTGESPGELESKVQEKIKEGNYEAAIGLLKSLADKDKNALVRIGLLYLKIGNHDNTISFLEEALKYNGNDFSARKFLAIAYYMKDDLDKSLYNAEKGLHVKSDPELQTLYDRLKRESRTQRGFVNESTSHFKVIFDGYEHGGVSRRVIGILEDAYKFIGNELNYFPAEPVTVILYTDRNFFDTTQAPWWAGGTYDPYDGKIRIPVKGVEGNNTILQKVLFHEYAHAVVHSVTEYCPLWINEGIAEYYSQKYPRKIGQVIPLQYLERSFTWLNERAGIAYLESYSAVSYLIERHNAYRMKELLASLSKGNDINKAFTDAFSITYNDFIAQWGKN